jgi:hypothetical protein
MPTPTRLNRSPLTEHQNEQLRIKLYVTEEYTADDAFELVLWICERQAGYPRHKQLELRPITDQQT